MSTPEEERVDLLFRNICKHAIDCILYGRITNLDAPSNNHRKPKAALLAQEREKEKKYLHFCLDQRRHFSPFVVFEKVSGCACLGSVFFYFVSKRPGW